MCSTLKGSSKINNMCTNAHSPSRQVSFCVPNQLSTYPLLFHEGGLCLPQVCEYSTEHIAKPAEAPSMLILPCSSLQGQSISSWKVCHSASAIQPWSLKIIVSMQDITLLLLVPDRSQFARTGESALHGVSMCAGMRVCMRISPDLVLPVSA